MSILNAIGMDSSTGQFRIGQTGDSFVIPGNLAFSGAAPTIAASTGAGSSPTVSISGTANSGQLTITTGAFPVGSNALVATITLPNTFANAVSGVIITPANATAAALSGSGSPFAAPSGNNAFTVTSGITGLVGGTTYKFNYSVGGW